LILDQGIQGKSGILDFPDVECVGVEGSDVSGLALVGLGF
jgi:hypothetical protein